MSWRLSLPTARVPGFFIGYVVYIDGSRGAAPAMQPVFFFCLIVSLDLPGWRPGCFSV